MLQDNFFPKATPESVGISSGMVLAFLKELTWDKLAMHGFIIIRKGKTIAEGYYKPFEAGQLHRMYSSTKSFVSVAIGLLCDEGRISLGDRVTSFFPELLPENVHPYIEAMTVRDLLMMSSAHKNTTYGRKSDTGDDDWVKIFFNSEPTHWPGQVFSYDTSATTVLTAIVERVSGKLFIEYMKDKMLRRMGFSEDAFCVRTNCGRYSWGGSGLCCSLRDLAKFAYMAMHYGKWDGEQLVSEEYMREATSRQIDNSITTLAPGYGYQFWMLEGDGFGTAGMGSQSTYCYRNEELILAVIADTQPNAFAGKLIEKAFKRYIKFFCGEQMPEMPDAYKELCDYTETLSLIPVEGVTESRTAAAVSGNVYKLEIGGLGSAAFKSVGYDFNGDEGVIHLENDKGRHSIRFGLGRHVKQDFPIYDSAEDAAGEPVKVYGFGNPARMHLPCLNSAAWVMKNHLLIVCRAVGVNLGTMRIKAVFDGEKISLAMDKFAERFFDDYQGFQSGMLVK